MRLQHSQEGIGRALEGQGGILLEDDIMHVAGPGGRVGEWRGHVANTEGGVTSDRLAGNGDVGPGLLGTGVAHEQVQHDGLDAHGQGDFQVQRRLQRQLDGLGARLHDRGIDEDQVGLVDDQLRDGGDYHEEANRAWISTGRMNQSARDLQNGEEDGEEDDIADEVAAPETLPMTRKLLLLRTIGS